MKNKSLKAYYLLFMVSYFIALAVGIVAAAHIFEIVMFLRELK